MRRSHVTGYRFWIFCERAWSKARRAGRQRSNQAEGKGRRTTGDFGLFLFHRGPGSCFFATGANKGAPGGRERGCLTVGPGTGSRGGVKCAPAGREKRHGVVVARRHWAGGPGQRAAWETVGCPSGSRGTATCVKRSRATTTRRGGLLLACHLAHPHRPSCQALLRFGLKIGCLVATPAL